MNLNEIIEPTHVVNEENIEPLPQQEVPEPIPSVEEQEQDVHNPPVLHQAEEKEQISDKSIPPVAPQEEEKEDSVPEQTPSLEPIPEEEEHEGLDISENETRPQREPTPPLVDEPCAPSEKEENKDTNSQSETTPRKNNQKKNNKKNNKKK